MINGRQTQTSSGEGWDLLSMELTGWRNKLMSSITKGLGVWKAVVNKPPSGGGEGWKPRGHPSLQGRPEWREGEGSRDRGGGP